MLSIIQNLKFKIAIFCFLLFNVLPTRGQQSIANYSISISSENLTKLNSNVYANTYYPAVLTVNDISYQCEVRYRGATSRNFPKKSWKIKFFNDENIFHAEKINLNAEYNDCSMMRNHLTMKLFNFLGELAPSTDFVKLKVNNFDMGVYVFVEEVEAEFFENNRLNKGVLFKANNHGASFSPLINFNEYSTAYEKHGNDELSYTELHNLLLKILYMNQKDFYSFVSDNFEVKSILTYYAVMFAVVSKDCINKNYYLYKNPKNNKVLIIPWDNDGTFGNDFGGAFRANYYKSKGHFYNPLIERMLEFEDWNELFHTIVKQIITNGFDYINQEIDKTSERIGNLVISDSMRKYSDSLYKNDINQLHEFITKRANYISENELLSSTNITQFYCSNPFPNTENPETIIRIKSKADIKLYLNMAQNFNYSEYGSGYSIQKIKLYDDGLHNDFLAGDSIYGNVINISEMKEGLTPITISDKTGKYYYATGFNYMPYIKSHTMALNIGSENNIEETNLVFSSFYKIQENVFFTIENKSKSDFDLSYCIIQGGEYYNNFVIKEGTVLKADSTILVSSNSEYLDYFNDYDKVIGDITYNFQHGDTVKLLSPTFNLIAQKCCSCFNDLNYEFKQIIINEINFKSTSNKSCGDWIELYNPNNFDINLTGWLLQDEKLDHKFYFPRNTEIKSDNYLVICRDTAKFKKVFPESLNYIGNLTYNFSSKRDEVKIYDIKNTLIDSCLYIINNDNETSTLELINPSFDNSVEENWVLSKNNGTPGKINSNYISDIQPENHIINNYYLYQNYPNPFNSLTNIAFDLPYKSDAKIIVYNLLGEKITEIIKKDLFPGHHIVTINFDQFTSGIFIYQLQCNQFSATKKLVHIK